MHCGRGEGIKRRGIKREEGMVNLWESKGVMLFLPSFLPSSLSSFELLG
jgi:hypothetical protein